MSVWPLAQPALRPVRERECMASDDDDRPPIEERVAQLEQVTQQQTETIREMLPSRRGVLAGAGLLGAGALAGAGSQSASAQAAAGQIGTESEPVDVEAASVNAEEQR